MGVLCWQRTTMTWTLFLVASLFMLGDIARGDDDACDDGWERIHRGCYRFIVDPQLGWEDARMDCQGRGGDLISVSDIGEKGKLLKKMKALDKNRTWWVGLKRIRGRWDKWIDDGPFSYRVTRWKRGEPNNEGGKENCAEISSRGELNDKDCNSLRAFICEQHDITERPFIPITEPPTTKVPTTTTTTTTVPLTSERSESNTQLPSTAADVIRSTSRNDITPDSSIDDDNEDDEDVDGNEGQDDTKKGKVTARPLNPITEPPTTEVPTTTTTTTQQHTSTVPVTSERPESKTRLPSTSADVIRSAEDERDLDDVYTGCFMLVRDKNQPFLYTPGSKMCPPVRASGVMWKVTRNDTTESAPCRGGKKGKMSFYCGGSPTCWRDEPNVDQCASPAFKDLLTMVSHEKNVTTHEAPDPKETVALTTKLANVTEGDEVTQEDITVTSEVLKSLVTSGATRKVKDKKEVENIVANVVKAGSNLVSAKKTRVWKDMAQHDKIRSATSLLVAMENATVAMAGEIDVPTTITTKDENIELQLRVINVTSSEVEADEEIVYSAGESDTHFSIPLQTLRNLSQGGLAKVVFMTHYTVGDILDGDSHDDDTTKTDDGADKTVDDHQHSTPQPKLASFILSASVGGSQKMVKLPEPISFTMNHLKPMPDGFHSLCSFWSIENGLGEWSQEGCRVARSNASQTTCECDHMTNFAVLMAVTEVELSDLHMSMLRLVTIIGCIISCLCLLASWVTFTCFTTLQGERNSIHKNLVVCLFIAEMLFLTGIDQTRNRLACGVVAGLLQYFFLAAFLWMMMEGVHIVLMLVQVFDASRSRMPYFYAGAYAPPVLIIAISAGLYHQGYGTENYCWLTTEKHFIWSFAGPVAVILFANSVILIYAMTMVCRHSEYVFTGKEKSTAGGIRTWIQGAMALEVLLGLTWIMGYFFLNQQSVAVAYVFTILNSTQGLFIFVFHCLLNKKARKEYRRVMKVKRRPSTTGSGSTQSASLGKNKFTSGSSFNRHAHSIDNPSHNYASHV